MYSISSNFPGVRLTTEVSEVQAKLPGYSEHLINGLIFERKGHSLDSNMTAWGLHEVVGDARIYKISKQAGLIPIETPDSPVRALPLNVRTHSLAPTHAVINARWETSIKDDGEGNNILGGNGRFFTKDTLLEIPVIEATEETLSYYGATLVKDGDTVSFLINPYPIWGMSIGKNYVDDCLMEQAGGGFYVEYHHDRPHFHLPLSEDAGGFYILGKKINEDDETGHAEYHFTAFKIPYGTGVYTSGGVVHCDAALTGSKWVVGYTTSEDFSTVNLRSEDNGVMTRIIGKE